MWVLISIGFIIFLCVCVWIAMWFNDWSERETKKNEKERLDLQRALIVANDKNKKRR